MAAPLVKRTQLWTGDFLPANRGMEKALNEIIKGSYIDQDIQSAYQAAIVQRHLLTAREAARLFLATGDPAQIERFNDEMKQTRRALLSLELKIADPERIEILGTVSRNHAATLATFKRVIALTEALRAARTSVVEHLGPDLAARLARTRDAIETTVSTDGIALDRAHSRARATIIGAIMIGNRHCGCHGGGAVEGDYRTNRAHPGLHRTRSQW